MLRKTILLALALTIGLGAAAEAQTPWRQVGFFRSESRNLSIGDGIVRVVSTPKFRELYIEGQSALDTTKVNELYPGWDRHSDVVVMYKLTPSGYVQTDYQYAQNVEEKALPGDTISTSFAVFDQKGTRRAKVPGDLAPRFGPQAKIVASTSGNLDSDTAKEWAVAIAGDWNPEVRGAPVNVSILDPTAGDWVILGIFKIDSLVRSGPIEIRDVTGDGKADVIYRTFSETPGYFDIDAHIYSKHEGLPEVDTPIEFNPRIKATPGKASNE